MLSEQDQIDMLERLTFLISELKIMPGDLIYGPKLMVKARTAPYTYGGRIELVMALNERHHQPIALNIQFGGFDGPETPVQWVAPPHSWDLVAPTPETPDWVNETCNRILRQLAMERVEGYTQYAASVHRAYVDFADV